MILPRKNFWTLIPSLMIGFCDAAIADPIPSLQPESKAEIKKFPTAMGSGFCSRIFDQGDSLPRTNRYGDAAKCFEFAINGLAKTVTAKDRSTTYKLIGQLYVRKAHAEAFLKRRKNCVADLANAAGLEDPTKLAIAKVKCLRACGDFAGSAKACEDLVKDDTAISYLSWMMSKRASGRNKKVELPKSLERGGPKINGQPFPNWYLNPVLGRNKNLPELFSWAKDFLESEDSVYSETDVWTDIDTHKPVSSKFKSKQWKNHSEILSNNRYSMLKDLGENHGLLGSSRARIIDLLGCPVLCDGFLDLVDDVDLFPVTVYAPLAVSSPHESKHFPSVNVRRGHVTGAWKILMLCIVYDQRDRVVNVHLVGRCPEFL